ncbi:hypothetical protein BpHYR1_007202 [Brachionus plicatilis]|uniref:Uncharacterized protein n=1 Tax=Brachionus plicatilis TaxID=10195 RepID=A0A3M7SPT8_BRAPC|nr:hypothetical protein BpHYR1_007202 [Brachionus plicatilis]
MYRYILYNTNTMKKLRSYIKWQNEAMEKIKSDGIWSISMTNNTSEGKRVYYRCNQVKRRAKQCPATIHFEWLMTKDGWYEGLQLFTPSTNNSLEATNRIIKDEDTLLNRLVFNQ